MASRCLITVTICGAVIAVIGIIAGFLRFEAELRHGNVGSRPDWVNPPYTPFDTFILGFPVSPLLIAGGALLLCSLALAFLQKFSN